MNIQLLDENLDIFPQNPNIFSQIVMIILKSRLSSKLILGLAAFKWLFGPTGEWFSTSQLFGTYSYKNRCTKNELFVQGF